MMVFWLCWGGGGFFEKQRFSHTLTDYRTSIPYPTHYILIVEGQIGHLNILCIYDTHSGGPSATHRTNREGGGGFFFIFCYMINFSIVFFICLKNNKMNITITYEDHTRTFEQLCNTSYIYRPLVGKHRPFFI